MVRILVAVAGPLDEGSGRDGLGRPELGPAGGHYARKTRPPSRRSVTDAATTGQIQRLHEANYGVYGIRKMHAELNRQGLPVARCTVQRLMRAAGLRGIARTKTPRTTFGTTVLDGRPDLVERDFTASAVNQLWVADLTYVRTFAGWVYAAFVLDVFSRRIVGWQVSLSLHTDLALDALQMGIWTRQRAGHDLAGLVHHSDRGVQYGAVRYTERLAQAKAVASVGTVGDSYDNAMAEAFNSLFKAELVRNKGPWRSIDDLEVAVAEYIDWYNHRRLHGEIGLVPPVEYEHLHPGEHPAAADNYLSTKAGTRQGRSSAAARPRSHSTTSLSLRRFSACLSSSSSPADVSRTRPRTWQMARPHTRPGHLRARRDSNPQPSGLESSATSTSPRSSRSRWSPSRLSSATSSRPSTPSHLRPRCPQTWISNCLTPADPVLKSRA
jgi:putative transposase